MVPAAVCRDGVANENDFKLSRSPKQDSTPRNDNKEA